MKTIKIENSYDLGDSFSNVTQEGAWIKLINYLKANSNLLSKLSVHKETYNVLLQSLDLNNLISIIRKIDPSGYFQKNLSRTIKLNLKFNKETKELELDNSLNEEFDDINNITYNVSYENNLKNDVYFSEDALLINYENISSNEINNLENALAILFFNKTKIVKDLNNEIISEETSLEHILLIYNRKTDKLKFINFENLNKENEIFNLSNFITKYNNNENVNTEEFSVNDNLIFYNFSNFKLSKTLILLNEPTENAIISFKNSLNKYIFDNFIELQYERNSEEIS